MARYRLRFVLQEFDLPPGITVIGRSLDCHLTIEDALVSRRHAQIVVGDDGAVIEDLGSRNGVKVNGATLRGRIPLRSGDRVRIGTQDLVFTAVDPAGFAQARTTGHLRLCATCKLPYAREALACPNCGATEQTEDDAVTASGSGERPHSWTVQLLNEALSRALRLGRASDADRIIRRATAQFEEIVAAGAALEVEALASLTVAAVETTILTDDPAWAVWAIDVYRRARQVPPTKLVDRLGAVDPKHRGALGVAVRALLERVSAEAGIASHDGFEALRRLEQLSRALDTGAAGDGGGAAAVN